MRHPNKKPYWTSESLWPHEGLCFEGFLVALSLQEEALFIHSGSVRPGVAISAQSECVLDGICECHLPRGASVHFCSSSDGHTVCLS